MMETRIGNLLIDAHVESATEQDGWIAGTMSVSAKNILTGQNILLDGDIPVGCYSDWTTSDGQWHIQHEGARLLLTVLTGRPCRDAIPDGYLPEAMPLLCEEMGCYIARELHRHLSEATS